MIKASQEHMHWVKVKQDWASNKPFKIIPNTSLNEKFNIIPDIHCEEEEYPKLGYFGIGIGGDAVFDNTDKYKYSPLQYKSGSLLEHIPFVLKKPNQDLTQEEQKDYRFRKHIFVGGEEYVAYYLKVTGKPDNRDFFTEIITKDGKSTLSVFNTNDETILSPKIIDKHKLLRNKDEARYVNKMLKYFFVLNKKEVDNLKEVFSILGKDLLTIQEIGIFSGIDKEVDGVIEAADVQLAYSGVFSLNLTIDMSDEDIINRWLEIGGSEPHYAE